MTPKSLFAASRSASEAIGRRLPQARVDIGKLYGQLVVEHLGRLRPGSVVVDVGGGRRCSFAKHKPAGVRLIAVDVSAEELEHNNDVDEKRVADISSYLPFGDAEVDMMVSSSVLEHLADVGRFCAEASRVMKPGGSFIHLLPGRFAAFAIVNRLLPHAVSRKLLYALHPGSEGVLGFRAYYDRCYRSALVPILTRTGFKVEDLKVSYFQSGYYSFFLPAFLLSAFIEILLWLVGERDLAAYFLVVARKAPTGD